MKRRLLLATLAGLLPVAAYAPKIVVTNLVQPESQCTELTVVGFTANSFTFCCPPGKWFVERAPSPAGPWTVISALNTTTCSRFTDIFEGEAPSESYYRLRAPDSAKVEAPTAQTQKPASEFLSSGSSVSSSTPAAARKLVLPPRAKTLTPARP